MCAPFPLNLGKNTDGQLGSGTSTPAFSPVNVSCLGTALVSFVPQSWAQTASDDDDDELLLLVKPSYLAAGQSSAVMTLTSSGSPVAVGDPVTFNIRKR